MDRQAKCRIVVTACGEELHQKMCPPHKGKIVRVTGFISRNTNRNGVEQLVLHAENIESI
jgi:primosomal replication protein N